MQIVQSCLIFFVLVTVYGVLNTLIMERSFKDRNILSSTIHSFSKFYATIFKIIEIRSYKRVSFKFFISLQLIMFILLYMLNYTFSKNIESLVLIILTFIITSFFLIEIEKVSNNMISNDSRVENWFMNILIFTITMCIVQNTISITVLSLTKICLSLLLITNVISRQTADIEHTRNESQISIIKIIWTSCIIYISTAYILSDMKEYFINYQISILVVCFALNLMTVFGQRQLIKFVKPINVVDRYKLESILLPIIILIGLVEWIQ